jgi:hypothetical protein
VFLQNDDAPTNVPPIAGLLGVFLQNDSDAPTNVPPIAGLLGVFLQNDSDAPTNVPPIAGLLVLVGCPCVATAT